VSQVDVSIRRRFNVLRNRSVELGADVFNVLNHPNFTDPDRFLGDGPAMFGRSQYMFNQFNQGNGGLNAVYQLGGPRSIQLSMKVKMSGFARARSVRAIALRRSEPAAVRSFSAPPAAAPAEARSGRAAP
jgi:hypothetical protein